MAIIYLNGFDHFTSATQHFDTVNALTMHPTAGRYGGGCIYENNPSHYGTKILSKNLSEIFIGLAAKFADGIPSYSSSDPWLRLRGANQNTQVRVHLDGDRKIRLYNGSDTLLAQCSSVLDTNWVYIEIRVKVHDTAGEVEVRINEQVDVNLSGLNTDPGGDGVIRRFQIYGVNYILAYHLYDDLYVDDAQFHGNVRVRTFMPTGDSATHFAWTRSGGSNDFEMVDEKPPDDDTTYIKSAVKGDKSAFTITPGTIVGPIKAIQISNRLYGATAALRRVRPFIRQGGADYNLPVTGSVGASYKTFQRIVAADPSDDNPWTQTKLENAEFGVEHVPNTTTTSTTTTT
jgi:hypothetical protein